MSISRGLYTALVHAMLPIVRIRLAWRARREPGYREHVAERFARYDTQGPQAPVIWIHAVSVGETRAAEPLVRALLARYPRHRVLMTHMTPTGRRMGEALYGDRVSRAYLPYDYPLAVKRFLEHFRPRVGVVMETEIWPNLIRACKAQGVPLVLVNARLSEKSFRGYRRFATLARESTSELAAIAAQTADDARRLTELGARHVTVTGNLKFDASVPPDQIGTGRTWRAAFGARGVWLAASTREGEEALVLDAHAKLAGAPLLVLVPRHPQRFDQVESLLQSRGVRYVRRSSGLPAPDTGVWLGDSMGEMATYFAACDVAFIGGSLLPYGAHNFIEACAIGVPVVLGPHTYNFAEAAALALEAGAALSVEDGDQLADTIGRLLSDRAQRAAMSARALEFSRTHQGATGKVMALLERYLTT